MKTRSAILFAAFATASFLFGATSLTAGESRPVATSKRAVCPPPTSACVQPPRVSCRWSPCRCCVNPVQFYRYGDPDGPVSASYYGYSSVREYQFYKDYPVSRRR